MATSPLTMPLPIGIRDAETQIVRRCQSGDGEAFRTLVLSNQRLVFAFLYRALGESPDIEDLAQEVFLRAHKAIGRFDIQGPARIGTWLLTIASRLVQDARRRKAVRRARPAPDEVTGTPESQHERAEIGRAIERAVLALPPEQRDAFVLATYHDLGTVEIAGVLGIPENTVKTRLFRARERLRASLGELWQETVR
jgi:RNA polymerase sigma-70 factor (ECF subfamily)